MKGFRKQKVLAFIMSIAMILGVIPVDALVLTAHAASYEGITKTVDGNVTTWDATVSTAEQKSSVGDDFMGLVVKTATVTRKAPDSKGNPQGLSLNNGAIAIPVSSNTTSVELSITLTSNNSARWFTVGSSSKSVKVYHSASHAEKTEADGALDSSKSWTGTLDSSYFESGYIIVTAFGGETKIGKIVLNETKDTSADTVEYTTVYDLRDGSIVTSSDDGKAELSSSDGVFKIIPATSGTYKLNGAQHGVQFVDGNVITITPKTGQTVSSIVVGGCQYSGSGTIVVASGTTVSGDPNYYNVSKAAKTSSCMATGADATTYTDDNALTFSDIPEDTSYTIKFDGTTYVPFVIVKGTQPAPTVTSVDANITIADANSLLGSGKIVLTNDADDTDKIEVTASGTVTLKPNAKYTISVEDATNVAVTSNQTVAGKVTTAEENLDVTLTVESTVVTATISVTGEDLGSAKLTLTAGEEVKADLVNGSSVVLTIGAEYALTVDDESKVVKFADGTKKVKAAKDTATLTVVVSLPDTQPHEYDVWDFGAEDLQSTSLVTYHNQVTVDQINAQYPGVDAGTLGVNVPSTGFDFGDVKYTPGAANHRLRTTNTAITRYDNNSKKDVDGNVYSGFLYSNSSSTSNAYISIALQKGDRVVFWAGSNGNPATYSWENPNGVVEATAKYTKAAGVEEIVFYASQDGTYKLYTLDEKLVVARILREHATDITVSGSAVSTDGASLEGAVIQFTQKSLDTDAELAVFEAPISGGQYSVVLQEGFAYELALSGKNGYIVESPLTLSYTRTSAGVAGSATASANVQISPVDLVTFTGNLGELDATNAAKLTMEFTVPEGKVFIPEFTLDKKANTYTLKLEKGVQYDVKAVGVDEFAIDKNTVSDADASGSTLNMTFTKRPVYNITVNVTGVTGKLKNLSLSFARLTDSISTTAAADDQLDGYTYDFTGVDGIQLRDGQYQIAAKLTGYTQGVTADLKVSGADATVTVPMVSNTTENVAYSETLQVGADKPYQTINAALTAIKNMSDRNGRRVTIAIDPGTYEEMLYIDMPNISLKNASSSPSIGVSNEGRDIDANAVRITGYYGHGYSYYSMNEKYQWDADTLAANKANGYESVTNPGSGTATMWNSTVVITGDNFTADDIIFENSFNIYVSKKATEDVIVKLSSAKEGSEERAGMEEGSIKVQEKAYVERAGALALANDLEGAVFNNCRLVGRQDVLYGGTGTFAEFNNCVIAGAVDFIYGGMTAIFDSCTLVANTTNDKNDIAYLAAPQQSSGRGYLFWNCTVRKAIEGTEISSELGATTNQALLGRPWKAVTGEAVFYNTKVMNGMVRTVGADGKATGDATNQLVIANVGWSSSLGGESSLCGEYNTVDESGNAVDVSERASWSKQFSNKMIILEDGSEMEITKENWRKPISSTVEWKDITYGSGANADRYWRTGSVADGSVQIRVGEFGNGVEFKNNGKWVPASYDGISYYYTTVPSYKNFTLRAKVHVNEFWLSNGQEAFGLMANDKLGGDGWNNSYAAAVTKTEYYWDEENQTVTNDSTMKKVSQKFGVMAQEKKGITTFNYPLIKANDSETIQNDFSSTLYPLEQRYPYSSNVIGNVLNNGSDQNITDMYLTIQKNNTGYFLTYESVDGSYSVTKKYYETSALNNLDPNKVYIGMFASRCADITFSDISFVITDPATDAPAEERPSEIITTVATISSAASSNRAAYDLFFNANADGKADVYINEELVKTGLEVEADTRLTIPLTLNWGNNAIKVVFDPNDDYTPGEYQVMSEYGEIEVEQTVVFNALDLDVIYSAPGANGNGSKEDPMDLLWALKYVQPGGTIYMMEGTYKFSSTVTIPRGTDGTEDQKITLVADPEATSMPVIDGSNCSGIAMEVAGNYWIVAGIAVTNSADGKDGMHISGSHNLIEGVSAYNNGNTGIQISRLASTDDRDMWPSYDTILNCTSYNNADKGYEDADGFAAKLTVGDGIVFDGCIAFNNADDGWDLFAKVQTGSIGSVTIQNCVAYANGYLRDGTNAGNGNGFKMGGDSMSGYHVLKNSVAFDNKAKGIDSNSCPDNEVYNCISFNNGSYNVALYTNNASKTDYVAQNVISYRSGSTVDTSENIKLVNQDQDQVFGEDCGNYFWKSPVMGGAKDASTTITDDWFERVDTYFDADAHTYSQSPVGRKADGTIDMKGLLILKAAKSDEVGYEVDPGQGTISTNIKHYERTFAVIPSISIADALTDEVKAAMGVSTEAELRGLLTEKLSYSLGEESEPNRELKVVDLKPVLLAEDGTFVPVTKDNFPSEGLDITITWDAMGFNGRSGDYHFCVLHLVVNGWNGQKPGTLETMEFRRSAEGLVVHAMSFSPFAIGWVLDDSSDDSDDDEKAGSDAGDTIAAIAIDAIAGKTGTKTGASPKTFDESRFVPEITEAEVAEFVKKQADKQLEQEVTDLLITPQATRFPYGIIVAAILALAAFIGGEVIYFRKKKNK